MGMEYLEKSEIVQYLKGKEKQNLMEGKDVKEIREIQAYISTLYSYRPTLQSQWIRRGETITCSRCGFKTLVYKNTKYCPECGRLMVNGRKNDEG